MSEFAVGIGDDSEFFESKASPEAFHVIPLEARITFVEQESDHTEWVCAADMARVIETYDNKVIRILEELQVPFEIRQEPRSGWDRKFYPAYALNIVRGEIEWRETYQELPVLINRVTVAEQMGRSYGWTTKTMAEQGMEPVADRQAGLPSRPLYKKSVLKEMRAINMSVPLNNGWYNLLQLVEYTGADREWIERRLNEAGYVPQRRRSSLTGKVSDFYSPDSVHELMKKIDSRAGPAGAWLTAHAITDQVDRSYNWVQRRLAEHDALSMDLQDDRAVTRKHYAPRIVDYLKEESDRIRSLPARQEGALSIHQVARKLGHATEWAIRTLDTMGVEAIETRDKKGRVQHAYPASILKEIQEYEKSHPRHERVITGDELLESLFAVDSIRAKIRLQRELLKAHLIYGNEVSEIEAQIEGYNAELKLVRQRHYRLIASATELPGFITGIKG